MFDVGDELVKQSDVLEQIKNLVHSDSFIVALLAEQEFEESGLCPHCNSDSQSVVLDEVMNLSNHMADLHLCPDCTQVFIIIGYPTLIDVAHPVFLQFTMKSGSNPIAEVVAGDMVRDIMARADATKYTGVGD